MRNHITRILGLTAAALVLATSAQAQGNGNANFKAEHHVAEHRAADVYDRGIYRDVHDRDVHGRAIYDRAVYDRDIEGRDIFRDGRRVPPGLAKKPGHMPPGQYKKLYRTYDRATVLGEISRRRGYARE